LEIYKLEKNVSMLATISGAGPMTGFKGQWWDDSGFHKMATAGGNRSWRTQKVFTPRRQQLLVGVGIIAYVGYNHLVVKDRQNCSPNGPMQLTY
jgi:biopolymer transport protein ExbB